MGKSKEFHYSVSVNSFNSFHPICQKPHPYLSSKNLSEWCRLTYGLGAPSIWSKEPETTWGAKGTATQWHSLSHLHISHCASVCRPRGCTRPGQASIHNIKGERGAWDGGKTHLMAHHRQRSQARVYTEAEGLNLEPSPHTDPTKLQWKTTAPRHPSAEPRVYRSR